MQCPAVLISASASGQGKTLLTAAMARAWVLQGLSVQAFKCGPDFIDSKLLQEATRRPVYNLDLGMCGLEDGKALLYQAAQNVDVIVLEGVMGLYDGTPSTADIAKTFNLPVALVIDASGMAQTFAAVAKGLYDYDNALLKAGVIANKVGSLAHGKMLLESLPTQTPWLGMLQRDEKLALPERHLGLHLADEITGLEHRINTAASLLTQDNAITLPPSVVFESPANPKVQPLLAGKTIAVANDAAFCFIYQANIDCLQSLGAKVVYFSLLEGAALPAADAYWIPGGYPELHLEKISQNHTMRAALQQAVDAHKPILAECGGMLALGEQLNGVPAMGLLKGSGHLSPKLQGLGTQHLDIGDKTISAHTFHYAEFKTALTPTWHARNKYGQGEAVYDYHSITASFLHFYFPSNLQLTAEFFTA